jgi:hypothetical protein
MVLTAPAAGVRLVVVAALLWSAAWMPSAAGQGAGAAATQSFTQAERNSVDLKHGMSIEEVQRLLGKPRRTALKNGSSTHGPSQGTLRWTYAWPGSPAQGTLHVEFAAKTPEEWYVHGWEWATY